MTNRFRWLPLVFALFVGGCGRESAEFKRQEAERAAEKAAKEAKEAEESTAKQRREEALAVIETLRKKHNATPSWKLRFGPTRKLRDMYGFIRHLTSFEVQQLLETTDDKPFIFVGALRSVIRKGAICKCVFSIVLDDETTADLEFESPEPQARDIIMASDTSDAALGTRPCFFAVVVREISVTETSDQDFVISMDISVSTDSSDRADSNSESYVSSGPRRVIHAKLIAIAPILIDFDAINDPDLFHFLAGQAE